MSSTPDELLPSTSALAPGSPSTTRSDCGQNGRVEIPSTPTSDIDDTAADLSSSRAAVERRFHAAALRRNERHSHADGGRPAALCAHVLLLLLLFAAAAVPATARRLPNIYWNSTNPIFRIDNTEHVFQVQILDQVDIICPYLGGDQQFLMDEDEIEFSQIYFVSRRAYDRCELEADARLVGVCRTPHERSDISLVFRSFTPLPGGLEYRPGQSYYFISTSDGTKAGMRQRRGGLCLYKNMKIKFEVLDKDGNMPSLPGVDDSSESPPAVAGGNQLQHRPRHGGKNAQVRDQQAAAPQRASDDRPSWLGGAADPAVVYANNGPKRVDQSPAVGEQSTTPLMYIVHTRPPPAVDSAAAYGTDYDDIDDDDGGGAAAASGSFLLLLICAAAVLLPIL